ncbi:heparinase II/III domain-containing protein [Falsiroseomonas sp. HW251]|uniref:heparinase II/III domain-containing protein n=1 Tax=Falsiroseomonas sp. HW251 TaxID=3390998 RepID=UPI003D322235
MSDQVRSRPWPGRPAGAAGLRGIALAADAARRLGPRPVALRLGDAALRRLGVAALRLADRPVPAGRFLPATAPPAPTLTAAEADRILGAAASLPQHPDWHRGFDPAAPALSLDLHRGAGARPAWEASRLAALPLLAQAARLDPDGPHLARADALATLWCVQNPPYRGVAWACGQEAALRALHVALALALLDADRDPPPGARALLDRCARRIAATPLYAMAQDNNHPISEAAGAFACALLLGRDATPHAASLAACVARLVAADGGFAQVSPGYARLALDVLAIAEWLRRRAGAPPFPAPLGRRAALLAGWLHRVCDPAGGAPRLGLEDDSAFADLSLCGPRDARGSVERAARLFAGCRADAPDDPGCTWLGLAQPRLGMPRPPRWRSEGTMGWHEADAAAVMRAGGLRFRPGQSDLLHVSLRDGATWILRDGGTGSYAPPASWWWDALGGAAAHNAPVFDTEDPMPRAGRFLLARWPAMRALPDGAAMRDAASRETAREIRVAGRDWTVEDRLAGPFRRVAWHWRLCPATWRLTADGAEGPATIAFESDAPLSIALVAGHESDLYGTIRPAPVLRVEAAAPVTRLTTWIRLGKGVACRSAS